MISWRFPLAAAVLISAAGFLHAETVKDREGAVRQDRATLENDQRWNYNDFEKARAQARREGKPLLVVLRCVPCKSCMGIDAQVVLPESDLGPLFDQFVCVRLINANTLDLSLFQFDYDLSFSTLFFNPDGTIYGRYGSWKHQRDSQDQTTASFRRALEAALAIHKGYPGNKAALAGKQGGPMPFRKPLEAPVLAAKYRADLDWEGKVVQSCVHCHQIGDAIRTTFRAEQKPVPTEWVYPFPAPETIGLGLAPDEIARVETVAAGSVAAAAGLQPGDVFTTLSGQPLVSIADVSWILHRTPESAELPAVVRRGGQEQPLTLKLAPGWRTRTNISSRVGTWPMRGMALGGLLLEDLPAEDRTAKGLTAEKLALRVKHVGQYGLHAAAKNAGFQKGDIVVSVDGRTEPATEGEVIGRLLAAHPKGDKVKVEVLRGAERVALTLPMQ